MRHWLLSCFLLLAAAAQAAPSAQAEREIRGLMDALASSQCQFQRNGSWHGREEARAHLQRKYDYLRKRNQVDSAEQFIERAASRSSVSGKPYRVRCPGQADVDAASWFGARLKALRDSGGAAR